MTTYYVSAVGSNAAGGTTTGTAWQTVAKINATTLVPGDTVLFRRGDTFSDAGLVLDNNGTASLPINIGAYGTGALPIIDGGGTDTTLGTRTPIRVDANYTWIDSVQVQHSVYAGIDVYGTDCTISSCTVTHNSTGVQVNGTGARAVVTGNQFLTNNILVIVTGADNDYGAQGLALGGANAEVSYNTFSGHYNSGSPDYGVDGCAIEIFGATNANVHHNMSTGDLILCELGNSTSTGNVIHHNLVYSTLAAAGGVNIHGAGTFGGVTGTKILHNTFVLPAGDSVGLAVDGTVDAEVRNNIFVLGGGMYSEATVALTEQGNVINASWIDMKGVSTVDATSSTAAAGLVSPSTGNFHLQSTSPAINRGVTTSVVFTADYAGMPKRGANWDSGAYELVVLGYTNNCEGAVAPGTNWTTANQGASGDALVVTRTGGTIYTTTTAGEYIHGTQSVKLTPGGVFTQRLAYPLTSELSASGRAYYRLTAAPGADAALVILQGSTGACAQANIRTTGKVSLTNANAGATPTGGLSPTALTFPCVIGLDLICTPGTSTTDGTARLVVYNADGSTFFDTGDIVSNFYRTGVVTEVRFGVVVNYTVTADSFAASNAYALAGPVVNTTTVPVTASVVAAGTVTATGFSGPAVAALTAAVTAAGNMRSASAAAVPVTVAVTAAGAVTAGLTRSATVPVTAAVAATGTVATAQGAAVALNAAVTMTRNMAAARGAALPVTATVVALSATSGHAEIAGISGSGVGGIEHGYAEIAGITGGASGITPPPAAGSGHAEIAGISGLSILSTDLQARAGVDLEVTAIDNVVLDGSLSTGAWSSATWSVVSDSRTPRVAPYPTTLVPIELSPNTDVLITVNFPAYPDTYTVVCQLTVTDGVTTSVDTATITVWAWIFWRKSAGKLVPLQRYRVVP